MPGCILDARSGDSFRSLINQILKDQADTLPDLGQVQVLLPELNQAQQFRRQLLQQAQCSALIPPRLNTLRGWVEEQILLSTGLLNTHARELMLVEILHDQAPFGPQHNPWTLADSLLRQFDDLQLSKHTAENLIEMFERGESAPGELSHFSEAAQKIKILWQYFHEQQKEEQVVDRITRYRQGLEKLTEDISSLPGHIYLYGINWLHAREASLILAMLKQNKLTILMRAEQPLTMQLQQQAINFQFQHSQSTEKTSMLNAVFDIDRAIFRERAATQAEQCPQSPLKDSLKIFAAGSEEQEARAIDLQTRHWLLSGKQQIAIVTENRRLARRVSALLKNAGLEVLDTAGWPLSTTMAAGVFERWLSTIENDFFHLSLLDVLKSGFIPAGQINIEAVYHFEKDIIERENIARSLSRYQTAIRDRSTRLDFTDEQYSADMLQILQQVETAAAPLMPLLTGAHDPEQLLDALSVSLQLLGLYQGFESDPAGQRILQELVELRISLQGRQINMQWGEFCLWLQRALETHNFRPAKNRGQVDLINFSQSNTGQYDALILAGVNDKQLPGNPGTNGFFNDNVRRELGLKHRDLHRAEQFSQFLRLLQASDETLITYTEMQDGNPTPASPWVELLIRFHQQSYHENLDATLLREWLKSPETELKPDHPAPLPGVTARPAPALPKQLLPKKISASAHQTLIDCPYRFFAARGLNLKPREAIAEQLSKRDYGTLVHSCLQRYHGSSTIQTSREQAIQQLTEISQTVFAELMTADFLDQSWWMTWENLIPHYIDWQTQREKNWRVKHTEYSAKQLLKPHGIELIGRIDRIDEGVDGVSLIDYKTGAVSNKKTIEAGEEVQLLSYAQLIADVHELIYLTFDRKKGVKPGVSIDQTQIDTLLPQVEERLDKLLASILNGDPLPAWGDDKTCGYCEFDGLCRRESWV